MTHTASPTKALTYAISYGLAGGPAHARQLKRLMRSAGYLPAETATADILIAHSAGCWLLPPSAKPGLVIYVGMPLAQTRPRHIWLAAKRAEFKHGSLAHSLKSNAKSAYYQLRQPQRNFRIIRSARYARPVIFPNAVTVFIANQYDPWTESEAIQKYLDSHAWAFISLPGSHDDIGKHPERYVAIINHYAGLLG